MSMWKNRIRLHTQPNDSHVYFAHIQMKYRVLLFIIHRPEEARLLQMFDLNRFSFSKGFFLQYFPLKASFWISFTEFHVVGSTYVNVCESKDNGNYWQTGVMVNSAHATNF